MYREQMYMFDNNIYAFLLLGILLFVIIVKKDIYDHSRKMFYRMIIFNMVILLVEILAWAFDGIDTQAAFLANYIFNSMLIILEPIMASLWLVYVDYKINRSKERLKKRWYYLQPSMFSGLLLIINIFTPIAFTIDHNNVYHRGGFLWLSLVFTSLLVLYTIVLAYINRKELSDRMIAFIAVFALLPILVSFIQLFVYGLILTWAVVALGIVFAYYLIEMAGNSVDFLTGLYSRKKIEEIIRGKIERKNSFCVVMIDLEYFKTINDKYGHKTGDETLVHFSKVLQRVFGEENYISRVGGDEFLIVSKENCLPDFNKYKEHLLINMSNYRTFEILSEVGVSFGAKSFDYTNSISIDKILDDVDELMYLDKSKNKNQKRRKADL